MERFYIDPRFLNGTITIPLFGNRTSQEKKRTDNLNKFYQFRFDIAAQFGFYLFVTFIWTQYQYLLVAYMVIIMLTVIIMSSTYVVVKREKADQVKRTRLEQPWVPPQSRRCSVLLQRQ